MPTAIVPNPGEQPDLELWRNVSAGRVFLKQFNQRGELVDHLINGGKTFNISPKERRINQEMAATEELDVFSNGMLSPVKLIETEEDTAAIANNPNLMAESEMSEIFSGHHKTFAKRVADISNPVTLQRLLEVAASDDVDAKVSQVDLIKARLEEVAPSLYSEVVTTSISGGSTGMNPTTPR